MAAAGSTVPLTSISACAYQPQPANDWIIAARIRDALRKPVIPDRDFTLLDYGAVEAFEKAIQACSAAGGGRIVIPEGTYRTGPIHLRSRIDLHVPPSNSSRNPIATCHPC
jgi:hypothetical protein